MRYIATDRVSFRGLGTFTAGQEVPVASMPNRTVRRWLSQGLIDVIDDPVVFPPDAVTVQAAPVAAPAALTSTDVTSPDPIPPGVMYAQVEAQSAVTLVNELKSDVNALRADVVALRTTVDTLLIALKGVDKPMAP